MQEKFTKLTAKYGIYGATIVIVAIAVLAYMAGYDATWVMEQINLLTQ